MSPGTRSTAPAREPVRVVAASAAAAGEVTARLRRGGVEPVRCGRATGGSVVITVADTVTEAVTVFRHDCPAGAGRLLVVTSALGAAEVRHAVRAGASVLLRWNEATPSRLAAAVRSAQHGEGRLPYDVLIGVLGGRPDGLPAPRPSVAVAPEPAPVPLTPRQRVVLALMADGHDNAAIARALSCSPHTVKNVIYDLMSRLQVRNRAHAVARAVRGGLI